jgi:hypothetical protein
MARDMQALVDRIEERLAALNLSDRKASINAIGKPDLVRDIRRGVEPRYARLKALADVLDTTTDYLWGESDISRAEPATDAPQRVIPRILEMEKDIPVYGTAIGADIEFMSTIDGAIAVEQTDLNTSDVIDRFRRPPALRDRPDIYGLYVAGTSMEPAFESGRGILVDPKRPPAIRDYVIVYIRNGTEASQEQCSSVLIKRLVKRSASFVELEQFNPPGIFPVSTKDIASMQRVMPWDEAFGL